MKPMIAMMMTNFSCPIRSCWNWPRQHCPCPCYKWAAHFFSCGGRFPCPWFFRVPLVIPVNQYCFSSFWLMASLGWNSWACKWCLHLVFTFLDCVGCSIHVAVGTIFEIIAQRLDKLSYSLIYQVVACMIWTLLEWERSGILNCRLSCSCVSHFLWNSQIYLQIHSDCSLQILITDFSFLMQPFLEFKMIILQFGLVAKVTKPWVSKDSYSQATITWRFMLLAWCHTIRNQVTPCVFQWGPHTVAIFGPTIVWTQHAWSFAVGTPTQNLILSSNVDGFFLFWKNAPIFVRNEESCSKLI